MTFTLINRTAEINLKAIFFYFRVHAQTGNMKKTVQNFVYCSFVSKHFWEENFNLEKSNGEEGGGGRSINQPLSVPLADVCVKKHFLTCSL